MVRIKPSIFTRIYFVYICRMKKKLTLWIILLPALAMAQTGSDTVAVHKKQKPVKVESINPNQKNQPIPDETKPDFSKESIFKALFTGGLNLSQIDGDAEVGYKKVGAHIGVGTVVKFAKRFSVSMELIYSMQGAKPHYATYSDGTKNKYDISTDYINVPISINVHDKRFVMFGAGLQLGVLTRFSQRDSAGNNITANPEPKGQAPRRFDLSGQVCATFFIKQRIGIGLRFSYSFLKLRDAVVGSKVLGEYNNVISIRFSYLLDPKNPKWKK